MPSFPDLTEPLTDGAVTLRLAEERDIPEVLIAYQDDPRLHRRLGLERPPSGADLGTQSERAEQTRRTGESVRFTILAPGSDTCVGQIYTPLVTWPQDRAEIGMWLAPQVRGRGLAARALRLASRWLLEQARLERLELLTETDNAPMLATAAAAGYVREGVLRGYVRERGERVDCVILSLLPADLPR